jgi:hypothetical protein
MLTTISGTMNPGTYRRFLRGQQTMRQLTYWKDWLVTRLLKQAFAEAARLPEDEQDRLSVWLLAELESDQKWDELLAGSPDLLEQLADEALAEHRAGETRPLAATVRG